VRSQAKVGLRKAFGPTVVLRTLDQLEALQLVLNPPKTSVIVIRTARGKSALFLVPAVLTGQKTVIVVVLYTALVNNLCNSVVRAGVDCKRWSHNYTDGELHALVVVSANITVDRDFLYYTRGLELSS
jgi:superfamily II DNA helicase RecQ